MMLGGETTMMHIPTTVFLALLGLTAFFAIAISAAAEKREAERKKRKEEAKRVRQDKWQKRKEAMVGKLMPWRR
jgi:hypothetical protein